MYISDRSCNVFINYCLPYRNLRSEKIDILFIYKLNLLNLENIFFDLCYC